MVEELHACTPLPLLETIAAQLGTNVAVDAGIAVHVSAFRRGPMYSYLGNGNIDLSYYPSSIIEQELIVLSRAGVSCAQLPPLALAIGAFAHFIAIHPFADGNGRAADRAPQRGV